MTILLFPSKWDAVLCPEGSFIRLSKGDFKFYDSGMVEQAAETAMFPIPSNILSSNSSCITKF